MRALLGRSVYAAGTALVLAGTAGCSILSGWGDLQGGTRARAKPDGAPDETSGPRPDASRIDSGLSSSGCAVSCAPSLCCVNLVPIATPSCATACSALGAMTLHCTDSRECVGAGANAVCCLISLSASCATSCAGGKVLCDPETEPSSCPASRKCATGALGVGECQ